MDTQFRMIDRSGPQEPSVTFRKLIVQDDEPDLSFLEQDYRDDAGITAEDAEKYRAGDRERLAAFHRGEWSMVGVRAVADILIPAGGNSFAMYALASPGCFGIESDSDASYFDEVFRDECATLKAHMRAMATAFQALRDE